MDDKVSVLRGRLERLRQEVSALSRENGFRIEPRIVGVTKGRSDEEALALFGAGVEHLAENRWESLSRRADLFRETKQSPCWHFIGALQRRSLRHGYRPVACVDTVDRSSVLPVLARLAGQTKELQAILIELDLTGIPGRSGVREPDLEPLLEECARWPELSVSGFLVMGPPPDDRALSRRVFLRGKSLFDRFFPEGNKILSMGMTGDFREAVAAGSTEIRIGRYFFEETEA
ncbi:MAG: alanine racemase [Nitrospirae bacterium]|nr:alanine racemase [Nitrospirota bacterium]